MPNVYEEAQEQMLRVRATESVLFGARVRKVLDEAGIPTAHFGDNAEGDTFCDRSGYHIGDVGKRFASIAVIGNSTLGDIARQMARDELTQRVRVALDANGLVVTVNTYGHLRAVEEKPWGSA